jgi:hypothetical protein
MLGRLRIAHRRIIGEINSDNFVRVALQRQIQQLSISSPHRFLGEQKRKRVLRMTSPFLQGFKSTTAVRETNKNPTSSGYSIVQTASTLPTLIFSKE